MTKQERIIVSAYTGYLMCDFDDLHAYIEKKLGRPVYTHELGNEKTWQEIQRAVQEDFDKLCNEEEER